MTLKAFGHDGRLLDAAFEIEQTNRGFELVLHSNGGASRGKPAHNPDYIQTLETLLVRLAQLSATLDDAWVDSKDVAKLDLDNRRIKLESATFPVHLARVTDIGKMRLEIRRSVSKVGRSEGERPGTGNKRIRLVLTLQPTPSLANLKRTLLGVGVETFSGYWAVLAKELTADPHDGLKGREWPLLLTPARQLAPGQIVALVIRTPLTIGGSDQTASYELEGAWRAEGAGKPGEGRRDRESESAPVGMRRLTSGLQAMAVQSPLPQLDEMIVGNWTALPEAEFKALLQLFDVNLEELPLFVGSPDLLDRRIRNAVWAQMRDAAPIVKHRMSKYVERGAIGTMVKLANSYRCQICEGLGKEWVPFIKPDSTPYVEAHHVVQVSTLDDDVLGPANVITVCPNHHRELHFGQVTWLDLGDEFEFTIRPHPSFRVRKFTPDG